MEPITGLRIMGTEYLTEKDHIHFFSTGIVYTAVRSYSVPIIASFCIFQ
jgi:hypothetical protein